MPPKVELRPSPALAGLHLPVAGLGSGFQPEEAVPGLERARGGSHSPRPARTVSLQLLGFFKGMSFPIASIAVVNSILFGVYSNALLVLTATSHQERRAQPPSYTHVFIAGCTGGFLQVRGCTGTHTHTHTHTCIVMISSLLSLQPASSDPQPQTPGLLKGNMRSGGERPAPGTWPGRAVAF